MYVVGQRWYSEAEPELGLGIVTQIENKIVQVFFAEMDSHRSYGLNSAPLKRFKLEIGDTIKAIDQFECQVVAIKEENNLYFYTTKTLEVPETQIIAQIDISGPMERMLIQNFDDPKFFELRYQSYLSFRNYQSFHYKGFLGAKINFIPHQMYICSEILKMNSPKAMLCDEVGLGKTIEAAIILHALIQRELVSATIIIVPDSLTNQWFIELYKKFSLSFIVHTEDEYEDIDFEKSQRHIVSTSLVKNNPQFRESLKNFNWDMLIVDESHQVQFFNQEDQLNQILRDINQRTYSSLFLSATPEIMGIENLFYQLNILDPDHFNNLEQFKQRQQQQINASKFLAGYLADDYKPEELNSFISPEEQSSYTTKDAVARLIADRFGVGRNYFRNSRSHLEKFNKLFTKRKLAHYPITIKTQINDNIVIKYKTDKLLEVIQEIDSKKILVLCQSKQVIQKIRTTLMEQENFKIALFHSEQSVLERDRQAAYFADPDGAQILLATQIGSEGRNFEFAHHLFLFDLPKLPDQLEQRIGRLDRIGQLNDILIHVPYICQTFEEILFRWYRDVLEAFTQFPKGGNNFYQQHQAEIKAIIESPYDENKLENFIKDYKQAYLDFKSFNEKNHDVLLEIRSYHPSDAREIIKEIETFEQNHPCGDFLDHVFSQIGIDYEQHNPNTFFIKPSHNMLIPSYPGLISDGMSITYNRDYASHHQNVDYVSWEHPIVKTALELTLNSPLGNFSIVSTDQLPRNIYFEYIMVLQCSDKFKYLSGEFLPYTPMRVLLDMAGNDHTQKINKRAIDNAQLLPPDKEQLELLKGLPKENLKTLSSKALQIAQKRSQKYISTAQTEIQNFFSSEVHRQKTITKDPLQLNENLAALEYKKSALLNSVSGALIQLDSLRLIIPRD